MITCRECIERLKPDDPRVKSGRYHLCGCDYCNKPSYFRELENPEPPPEVTIKEEWKPKQWDVVNQLRGSFIYLQGKLNEHLDKKGDFL